MLLSKAVCYFPQNDSELFYNCIFKGNIVFNRPETGTKITSQLERNRKKNFPVGSLHNIATNANPKNALTQSFMDCSTIYQQFLLIL